MVLRKHMFPEYVGPLRSFFMRQKTKEALEVFGAGFMQPTDALLAAQSGKYQSKPAQLILAQKIAEYSKTDCFEPSKQNGILINGMKALHYDEALVILASAVHPDYALTALPEAKSVLAQQILSRKLPIKHLADALLPNLDASVRAGIIGRLKFETALPACF